MRIGLDLDNTIIDYDAAFSGVGVELGLLPENLAGSTKREVSAHLLDGSGGERDWMYLQGQVYGRFIDRARLYDGVERFLSAVHGIGGEVWIVSHKTRHGHYDEHRVVLWDAALAWLEARGLFDDLALGLSRERVLFEETRAAKISRIRDLDFTFFVDDLAEVLLDPEFPAATRPLWFAPGQQAPHCGLAPFATWDALTEASGV